jgi:hypothetical protein
MNRLGTFAGFFAAAALLAVTVMQSECNKFLSERISRLEARQVSEESLEEKVSGLDTKVDLQNKRMKAHWYMIGKLSGLSEQELAALNKSKE